SRLPTVSPRGAGDGIRTRDIQLGRLELYQLSYTRLSRRHRAGSRCIASPRPPCSLRGSSVPLRSLLLLLPPRHLVGRKGFEPLKPEGRQIYSLMRLAASLPPH